MLKTTASKMKVSSKPSKATVIARPVGYTETKQRWAEQDARAKAYKDSWPERRALKMASLNALNRERYAATRAEREAKKEAARRRPIRVWDNYEEIAVIQKSPKLRFHIAACTRDGFRCVAIREFYLRQRDGTWMPGRNGISIPLASPLTRTRTPDPNNIPVVIYPMREFFSALQQAIEIAQEMELANPENAIWIRYEDTMEDNKNENS